MVLEREQGEVICWGWKWTAFGKEVMEERRVSVVREELSVHQLECYELS